MNGTIYGHETRFNILPSYVGLTLRTRIYPLFYFSFVAKVSPINIAKAVKVPRIYLAFSADLELASLIKIIIGDERDVIQWHEFCYLRS